MKKIFNKKSSLFLVLLLVVFSFVFFTKGAAASNDWAHWLVGGIARAFVSVLGWLIAKIMGVLVYVAQYNDFINSAAVVKGWVVARDIANMFFIVILLIIAFGTILNIENYNYKKWLPKLILMAILINFSKTICGLLIDLSQIIMLTFVNTFAETQSGSLIKMLGVSNWQSLEGVDKINNWEIAAAYVLAVIYALITLVVLVAMVGILVMRIIMIWIYVVLSPFAYLLAAFPGGASYSSQWWQEFTKNLIVGPVLAFFIWLSFASLGTPGEDPAFGTYIDKDNMVIDCKAKPGETLSEEAKNACQFGTSNLMIQFIIAIGMLLGGMTIAKEIGGAGGAVAGQAMGKIKGVGLMTTGAVGGYALAKAKGAAKTATNTAKTAVGTGAGWADRSLGNLVDQAKGGKTDFGSKGLVKTSAGAIKNVIPKTQEKLASKIAGSESTQEINEARRDLYELRKKGNQEEAVSLYGKKYKLNSENNVAEWDDENKRFTGNTLKDEKGRDVKGMNASQAAMYDSSRDNRRATYAASDKKQVEKVETRQKELENMNMSAGDIVRTFSSASTSATDKKALAMIMAKKGLFKDQKQVQQAKSYLGGNKALANKFSSEMDATQPDLNYNLEPGSIDIQKFEQKIASGKIKLDASNIGNLKENVLALFEKNLPNFEAQLTNISKDLSPKDFSKVKSNLGKVKVNKYREGDISGAQKTASIIANISGNWGEAFKNHEDAIDQEALAKYISTTTAKNLNNMAVADFKALDQKSKKNVLENITAGKLAAMMREDSNAELVRQIRDEIMNGGTLEGTTKVDKNKENISANAALLSY